MHANHSNDDDHEQSAREHERQMAHDRVLASDRDAANAEWRGKCGRTIALHAADGAEPRRTKASPMARRAPASPCSTFAKR